MKYLLLFSALLPYVVSGQNYRVLYRGHVSDNLAAFEKGLEKKGIILNDFDNKQYPGEDSLKAQHFFEAMKAVDNRMVYAGVCTPTGQYYKVYIADSNTNAAVNKEWNDSKYLLHNYRNYYTTFITERKGITDTTRRLLDTAAMHMQPTGKTRIFSGRTCREYEPFEPRYRYFSLWADATLPAWVHPCLFWGLGVEGGIVAVTFKSGTHTLLLESITETGDPVPRIPYYEPPVFKYLPFGRQIGNYNSLQLPD